MSGMIFLGKVDSSAARFLDGNAMEYWSDSIIVGRGRAPGSNGSGVGLLALSFISSSLLRLARVYLDVSIYKFIFGEPNHTY